MFLFLHVTRLLFYGVLGWAVYIEELPWWVVVAWILWDNKLYTMVKIPFTKGPKEQEFNWANYKGPTNTPGNDNNLGVH